MRQLLTVRDIAAFPGLGLGIAAGGEGLGNEVSWLHVSELADPTEFLEGGELLLTTGLGIGEQEAAQRDYVGGLAEHGLAGLGFGVGFGYPEVPAPIVEEADRRSFPVLSVPYDVPFVAITKAAARNLANEQLLELRGALEVHERLAEAVLQGQGIPALLAIVCTQLNCSLALVDENGRIVGERHGGTELPFEEALELPVNAHGETATLKAVRDEGGFGEYDRLVLHHGQTALAFELSRRRAVGAAELRLAGDLLDDLESSRLDDREVGRRIAAFGLEPERTYAALLAVPQNGHVSGEQLRRSVAEELDRCSVNYLSTARPERASFLVSAAREDEVHALARRIVEAEGQARVGIGRPSRGRALGRSLLEARAALDAVSSPVASYHDLGSLELLLSLSDAALEAFVDRVLGPTADNDWLMSSLTALLDTGCCWSEAAEQIGVHRHTLRYRMDRLREQTGRHPDDPEERMELWLAVKANQALAARAGGNGA